MGHGLAQVLYTPSYASASFSVVLTTFILRLSQFGQIKRLQVLAFNRRLKTMTSFVCLSAVSVKAKTGIPEKIKKRNQFYSLVFAHLYLKLFSAYRTDQLNVLLIHNLNWYIVFL